MKYENAEMVKEFVGRLYYYSETESEIVRKCESLTDDGRFYKLQFRFAGYELQHASRLFELLCRISECDSHFTTLVYRTPNEPEYKNVVVECL